MNEYVHTARVQQRTLALFTALTDLFNRHRDFKLDPTQANLDALTQSAADFETKVEMIRQTLAYSVKEIVGGESDDQVEGQTRDNGIEL